MTFQTATYTTTGQQTALNVTPTSNVFLFIKAGSGDRYNIKYKVDSTGLRRIINGGDNKRGTTKIIKIDEPASEVSLNITTNVSADIIFQVKEY